MGIYYAVKEDNPSTPDPTPYNKIWVAVGGEEPGNGNILYSSDGLCWLDSTGASFSTQGNGVAYGTSDGTNPLWVAVGNDLPGGTSFGNIMYSADGKEWQETTVGMSFLSEGFGVAYGTSNGTSPLWVAVGHVTSGGNGTILYSDNGKDWQESTGMSFSDRANGITYSVDKNGLPLWIAVGNYSSGGKTLYSINGKEWQEPEDPNIFSIRGNDVAFESLLPNVPGFY